MPKAKAKATNTPAPIGTNTIKGLPESFSKMLVAGLVDALSTIPFMSMFSSTLPKAPKVSASSPSASIIPHLLGNSNADAAEVTRRSEFICRVVRLKP